MEVTEINKKLDELQSVLAHERESFKQELEEKTSKTASEFKAEQERIRQDVDRLASELEAAVKASKKISTDGTNDEYVKAFDQYIRKGRESDILEKAMDATSPSAGGITVPEQLDDMIVRSLDNISVVRENATVLNIPNRDYTKIIQSNGAANWVSETAPRPETAAPTFTKASTFFGTLYAAPRATEQLLQESKFDIEQFLAEEVSRVFATTAETAFWVGDGTDKPKGIVANVTGSTPYYVEHQSATAGQLTVDDLIDVHAQLKNGYLKNAKWYISRAVQAEIRKMKYADNSPVVLLGQQGFTINGYDVVAADDLPTVATGARPVVFGDLASGYTVLDVGRTVVVRDPYSAKPYIEFYTSKTIGSMYTDNEAIVCLTIS